ncbi:ABC transporter ATP-binding protein [Marinobacter sp. M216]|uniref:ABC transporter ATP-binding protein n=1 Tax=Marinobacter albus TaxID=3030833 RepID=A0ABT7H999_9GAMM|nr:MULTISPECIES: ABC transporter ATP-binding protein [unclassified Marinobacter]MBW7471248.1 ABC transporter ATP-binding protein [Marinobacter sp. F4218]MDK9556475.1 ABC transporter ATP-binding protein [Marinobacter sp. M216]
MTPTTESAPHRAPGPAPAIETTGLSHCWDSEHSPITFPDLTLPAGEHLFLHGPSGSGKSTFLSLLSGMLSPSTGGIGILGTPIHQLNAGDRDRFRADHIGVIFQQFNLVPYLSAEANVTLPCRLSASRRDATDPDPTREAHRLLTALAIPKDCWPRSVTRLSIGQQQRIAAARALIGGPEIILADEPTSALDSDNRDRFLDLLLTLAEERNTSVLFVSHDRSLAQHFTHQVRLTEPEL